MSKGTELAEVVYALPEDQVIISVRVDSNITARELIEKSGILNRFSSIDLRVNPIGIFGKRCQLDDPVYPADRIEIYRPLLIDPKEKRRQRARGE